MILHDNIEPASDTLIRPDGYESTPEAFFINMAVFDKFPILLEQSAHVQQHPSAR